MTGMHLALMNFGVIQRPPMPPVIYVPDPESDLQVIGGIKPCSSCGKDILVKYSGTKYCLSCKASLKKEKYKEYIERKKQGN